MVENNGPSQYQEVLTLLQRMMDGECLRLGDLLIDSKRSRATYRRRLQAIADCIRWAHRSGAGPGYTEEFWWTWPSSEESTREQVWVLAAARSLLSAFRDGEIGRVLSGLLVDHMARLPSGQVATAPMDRAFVSLTNTGEPLEASVDIVDRLATAISRCSLVRADYSSFSGDATAITMEPWTIVIGQGGMYVYGRCRDSQKTEHIDTRRLYNVARFGAVSICKETFVYPLMADYDPGSTFGRCFGTFLPEEGEPVELVRLRFDERWRGYLARHRIHRSQFGEPVVGGDARVDILLETYVTYDLVRWVRGHGNEVEVVEPTRLREWVESGKGASARNEYV